MILMTMNQDDDIANACPAKDDNAGGGFFSMRSLLWAFLLLAMIVGYTRTPRFSNTPTPASPVPGWFAENILGYYRDIPGQLRNLSLDERMFRRHGYSYYIPDYLKMRLPEDAVFLVPPERYLERTLQEGAGLWAVVPRVLYYFAGPIRTVYLADPPADDLQGDAASRPRQTPSRMIAVVATDDLVREAGVVVYPSGDPVHAEVTHSLIVLPDKSMRIVRITSDDQLRALLAEFGAIR